MTDLAREALAKLRQDARQRPTPVVVKVEGNQADRREDRCWSTYVSAAKEAVRLSGTEFVLEDRDLHKRVDMTWTLESIHDGALKLTSTLDSAFRQSEETFAISFVDSHDLPRRIADLARSRLRRIRYVWAVRAEIPGGAARPRFHPGHAGAGAEDQLDGSGAQRVRRGHAVHRPDREQHQLQQAAAQRRNQVPPAAPTARSTSIR